MNGFEENLVLNPEQDPNKNITSLGCYNNKDKKVSILLYNYQKYTENENKIIDMICFTLEHEYIHKTIAKINHPNKLTFTRDLCIKEEFIIASMIGFYKGIPNLNNIHLVPYNHFWETRSFNLV